MPNSALLICETHDATGMTGYVFVDTDENGIIAHTFSAHAPVITEDGILIPA